MSYDSDNFGDPVIDGIKLYYHLYEKSERDSREVLCILLTAISVLQVKHLDPEEYELAIEVFSRTIKKSMLILQNVQQKN
jgi:hypothetical protein